MEKINKKEVKRRVVDSNLYPVLVNAGVKPAMARLYASRGIDAGSLAPDVNVLPPKDTLEGCLDAASIIADAVMAKKTICLTSDFDVDGCTSGSIFVRALRSLGANVFYIIPHRILEGYGISPALARRAKDRGADLIITTDNGVSAFAGVLEAKKLGMDIVVTDHHMSHASGELPVADVHVNPNIAGRKFPARNLAGVGVAFYVLSALREELKHRGYPKTFNMGQMIDLVSMGTVGDMVRLDNPNRAIVNMGISRLRAGSGVAGSRALMAVTGCTPAQVNSDTLGFLFCPRVNAAGRLQNADIGVEMMITDDFDRALKLAGELDAINAERKTIQAEMTDSALEMISNMDVSSRHSLVVFSEEFAEGVVGLVASKMKEMYHLPSGALTLAEDGNIKGSFRSIDGVHIKDVIDLVASRSPGLMVKYGGHAGALGGTIAAGRLDEFTRLFEQAVIDLSSPEVFVPYVLTDGELATEEITQELVELINAENWGQGFPSPLFEGTFKVLEQRLIGSQSNHTKLVLGLNGARFDAILFSHDQPLPSVVNLLYKISINEYKGVKKVQLMVDSLNY